MNTSPATTSCSSLEISPEILNAIRNCLGGLWATALDSQIRVKPILGGLTNTLYFLELIDSNLQNKACEENKINRCILRIFSKIWSSENIERDNSIFGYIAKSRIGPALLGTLPNQIGRLEEFYDARPLLTKELSVYSKMIAQSLSAFHKLDFPADTGPAGSFLFRCMRSWLESINQALIDCSSEFASKCRQICSTVNLAEEIAWLEEYTRNADYLSTAFCHNDVNENNILLMNNNLNDIKLIDFEYSSKNYRGFEFANVFFEFTLDYSAAEYPYFSHMPEKYPTLEQRRDFFCAYLSSYEDNLTQINMKNAIDRLISETDSLQMMVNMFWTLWSLSMYINDRRFGYPEYANFRLKLYLLNKKVHII